MNPLMMRIAVISVCLALAFTSGWKVCDWRNDANALSKERDAAKAYQDAVARANEAGGKLEAVLAKLEANKFVVQKEVNRETVKQIYSDCVLPASGVRLYNQSTVADPR